MNRYFGTDGIRGVYGCELTCELAFFAGRALAQLKENCKILIGRDTRKSGQILTLSFASGAMSCGADVVDVGVCPTAGVAYLTLNKKYDFGVVVSASHNPKEFNGLKFFSCDGRKLNEKTEKIIEKLIINSKKIKNYEKIGRYIANYNLLKKYNQFLLINGTNLEGLKIVLDCANGASSFIAIEVFKELGAQVITINNKPNGENINQNCGSTNLESLIKNVLLEKADMGFAFDGDSDRVIAVDENGRIIDGDLIIYIIANYYLKNKKLNSNKIVGTVMTNIAIENALKNKEIKLIRTDVGDKNIDKVLEEKGLSIGGEQCGHVILKDKFVSGDGILNAIVIASIVAKEEKLSKLIEFNLVYQEYKNIKVKNKNYCIKSKKMNDFIKKIQFNIKNNGRIIFRASGTEPVIRVMVELDDREQAKNIIKEIEKEILIFDGEYK